MLYNLVHILHLNIAHKTDILKLLNLRNSFRVPLGRYICRIIILNISAESHRDGISVTA